MPGLGGLRSPAEPTLPLYGDKDLLFQLSGALLSAGNAGADSAGDAFFGAKNAAVPSGYDITPCGGKPKRKKKIGART